VFNGLLYLYGGVVTGNPRTLTNITQIYNPALTSELRTEHDVTSGGLYGTAEAIRLSWPRRSERQHLLDSMTMTVD